MQDKRRKCEEMAEENLITDYRGGKSINRRYNIENKKDVVKMKLSHILDKGRK